MCSEARIQDKGRKIFRLGWGQKPRFTPGDESSIFQAL
jgi:hypothetical protein